MTRNAMPKFESFDPEVLEAARDVAARAGVPLETWIASVVPQQGAPGNRRERRRHRAEQAVRGAGRHDAVQDDAYAERPEPPPGHRQDGGIEAPAEARPRLRREARPQPVPADPYGEGFAALMSRLDGLDRALDAERRAGQEAEARRLAEIEARIERAVRGGPAQQVTERLGDIERRMSQLGEQFAASRPPGRRGRPTAAEIRDAVQDIRQRQRELAPEEAAPADGGVVASMRMDLARRLDVRTDEAAARATAVSELQREAGRLREAVARLATGRDVGVLEQAIVSLATGVERAQPGTDLTAIAAPVEHVRAQVERLAEDGAETVHTRIADDVRRLAGRLDGVAAVGTEGPDRQALAGLFGELDEIRRLMGLVAGPERVQGLAEGLEAVSAQIAQFRDAGTEPGLHPLPEDIHGAVMAAEPAALAERIQALAGEVDALCASADRSAPSDEPGTATSGDAAHGVTSIQAMLHSLAEKVDRVGSRPEGGGLDALENQVLTLADRLEAPRGGDPALAGLERTLDDLLQQVTALREAAPSEAAVERAARSAVAQTLKGSGIAADPGEIGLLRASLADMQARQAASDQRLGATLDGVQSALDRLVNRLGPADASARGLDERLRATTSPEAVQAHAGTHVGPHAGLRPGAHADPVFEVPRLAQNLLEPGAGRPAREPRAEIAPHDPAGRRTARERAAEPPREPARGRALPEAGGEGDIKTSFIAAARRAAQAAQAELAAEAPADRRDPLGRRTAPAAESESRIGRLRAEIDRRRRPLLLGLAAIVLALGALQAIGMRAPDEAPRPAPIVQPPAQPRPEASKDAPREAAREVPKEAAKEVSKEVPKPAVADPQTTQALATPLPADARPAAARAGAPQVSGMNALAADLGNLPPGLAKMKQAALDGDGGAVWELAMREADGRGMPRDLSVAAKLYEKLATAGYAPAQYKLAGHYEKGSGLVRDLDKAKLWYGRAAEQGHARSMHNLAVIYAENPAATGKPDFASAASWFRQGAEYGVRDSQYNLAVLYARGLGLTQDLVQSYAWFAAAAAQGDDDAAKKRDDVANKLSPADLASAKSLAATFKPRKLDAAVNEAPVAKEPVTAPMSLLGAPSPSPTAFTPPARKTI